jgi:hypothetical protein
VVSDGVFLSLEKGREPSRSDGQPTIYPLPSISVTRAHTSVEKASMLIALMVRKE